MKYCKEGDKPKIYYRFGDGRKGEFLSQVAPIEVLKEVKESIQEKYLYFDPNIPGQREVEGGTYYKTEFLNYCNQGQTAIRIFKGETEIFFSCYLQGSLQFIPASGEDKCILKINNSIGVNLFTIEGKCPLSFEVACGNCPEGSHECKHDRYPGYCCVPCKATGDRLKNMAAKVGR